MTLFLTPDRSRSFAARIFRRATRRRARFPRCWRGLPRRGESERRAGRGGRQLARRSRTGRGERPNVDTEQVLAARRRASERGTSSARTAGSVARQSFRGRTLSSLLRRYPARDVAPLDMVLRTLDAMALGGMYDQIGGGFHRYSPTSVARAALREDAVRQRPARAASISMRTR